MFFASCAVGFGWIMHVCFSLVDACYTLFACSRWRCRQILGAPFAIMPLVVCGKASGDMLLTMTRCIVQSLRVALEWMLRGG